MPHINLPFVETAPGTLTRVECEGRNFVIVRTEAEIYAYVDACPHAFWPLSDGTLRDGVLECPGHGWEFNVRTGRCLNAPDHCLAPVSVVLQGEAIRLGWEEEREPVHGLCPISSTGAAS